MVAEVRFSEAGLTIQPGDEARLTITVHNLGDRADTYSLLSSGPAAAWVQLEQVSLTLAAGAMDSVAVLVRPPRQSATSAGPVHFSVRAVSHSEPDDVGVAELAMTVQAFDDRRVHVLQPVQRARRAAVFEVMLENRGNEHSSCRLHLVDTTGRVDGRFDPPSLGVEPGGNALAQLRLKATGRRWRRSRFLPFHVEAVQQGHDTVHGDATLVQTPVVPDGSWRRALAAAAALGAIAAAWFAFVRPALDDAAADAVNDRIAELVPPTTTDERTSTVVPAATVVAGAESPSSTASDVTSSTAVVPTSTPDGTTAAGEPFSVRLVTSAPVGSTEAALYTVPEGFTLLITDVIVQNPYFDAGQALLMRNSEVQYNWSLDVITTEQLPIVTPMQFVAGDNLTFQVTCREVGDISRPACEPALTLLGRLVPA